MQSLYCIDQMRTGDQSPVQQPFGFLLIGTYHRRHTLKAMQQCVAIRVEQSFHLLFVGELQQFFVVVRGHPGWYAPADYEPGSFTQLLLHCLRNLVKLTLGQPGSELVQLYGQSLLVCDGQVCPHLLRDRYELKWKGAAPEARLELLARLAAACSDRQGFATKTVDNP